MLRNLSFFCNSVYFIIFSCFCQYLKPHFIPVFHLSAHKKQGTPKTAIPVRIISFSQLCSLLIMHINEYPVSFSDIQCFSVEKAVFSALLKKHFSVLAQLSSLLLILIHFCVSFADISVDIRALFRDTAECAETRLYLIGLA